VKLTTLYDNDSETAAFFQQRLLLVSLIVFQDSSSILIH